MYGSGALFGGARTFQEWPRLFLDQVIFLTQSPGIYSLRGLEDSWTGPGEDEEEYSDYRDSEGLFEFYSCSAPRLLWARCLDSLPAVLWETWCQAWNPDPPCARLASSLLYSLWVFYLCCFGFLFVCLFVCCGGLPPAELSGDSWSCIQDSLLVWTWGDPMRCQGLTPSRLSPVHCPLSCHLGCSLGLSDKHQPSFLWGRSRQADCGVTWLLCV